MHLSVRLCWQFFISAIITFVIASIAHSQFVLLELSDIGIDISLANRLSMTIDDLLGLLPTYGVIITFSLIVAFGLCSTAIKRYTAIPMYAYVFAGTLAIGAALVAMHPILNISLIAGSRSHLGFVCQCLAGTVGGWVYYKLIAGVAETAK